MTTAAGRPRRHRTPQLREAPLRQRVVAGVLTAGALAGAVTAVVSLWPDPDALDSATFTSGVVSAPSRLSDYVASVELQPFEGSAGLGQAVLVGLVATSPSGTGGPTPDPTPTGTGATTDQPTPTTDPPTTPTTSGATTGGPTPSPLPVPAVLDLAPLVQQQFFHRLERQRALDDWYLVEPSADVPEEAEVTTLFFTTEQALDATGVAVSPAVAAERLARRLAEVRSLPRQGKLEPVGALARVDLDLVGLRGDRLVLYWRLVPADPTPDPTAEPLPPAWQRYTAAYQLTPGTDHDTASLDVWVPLPRAAGPYQLDLVLATRDSGARLAGLRTEAFDGG